MDSDEVPPQVAAALYIPPGLRNLLPKAGVSIEDLLSITYFPPLGQCDENKDVLPSFTQIPPPYSLTELASRAVPALPYLLRLESNIQSAVLEGNVAFIDSRINKPTPFFMIPYWIDLGRKGQSIVTSASAARALHALDSIAWKTLLGNGLTPKHAAMLVSPRMISTGVMDAMVDVINARLKHANSSSSLGVEVHDLTTFSYLRRASSEQWGTYETSSLYTQLRNLGNHMKDGTVHRIFLPLNINNNHRGQLPHVRYQDPPEMALLARPRNL